MHVTDIVVLAAGEPHELVATGDEPLVLPCGCAPPLTPGDTVATER